MSPYNVYAHTKVLKNAIWTGPPRASVIILKSKGSASSGKVHKAERITVETNGKN